MKLTPRQEQFCAVYVETGNASEAYRRAYPRSRKWKPQTLWSRACRALKNAKVSARIHELRQQAIAESGINAAQVIRRLNDVAFFNVADLFDFDGHRLRIKPSNEWTPAQRAGVKKLKARVLTKEGDAGTGKVLDIEIEAKDDLNALDKLARHLGLYKADNHQSAGTDNAERLALRELFRAMTPEERRQWLEEHRE